MAEILYYPKEEELQKQFTDILNNISHQIIEQKRGNTIIKRSRNVDDEFLEFICSKANTEYTIPHHKGRKVMVEQVLPNKSASIWEWKDPDESNIYLASSADEVKLKIRII